MNDIGSTVLLAQAVIGRACVEHQRARGARSVGDCEKLGGRKVDDEKRTPSSSIPVSGRDRVFAWGELGVDDREGLIEEAAGRVVVVHRHARAGDEVVRGRDIEDRDRLARCALVDDADLDRERIGVGRLGERRGHREQARKPQ